MKAFNLKRAILPNIRNLYLSASLGLVCVASQAFTLGNVRGAVWVGKNVNVVIPVQLDAGEQASSVCAEVDVSYADNHVDSTKVRRTWQSPEATGEGLLRIQTSATVDEPVVSILVRAGCVRKLERRYVLLADMPNDGLPSIESAVSSGVLAKTLPSKNLPKSSSQNTLDDRLTSKSPKTTPSVSAQPPRVSVVKTPTVKQSFSKKEALLAAPEPKVTPVSEVGAKVAATVPEKSRLRLEPLPESIGGLKASLELITVPTENEQERTDARAIWRSLNAQPADLIVDKERLQAMDSKVKALESSTAKSQADQQALKVKLSKAEEDQYSNAVVGVLAALLLCALAGAGYLWVRMRRLRFGADKDWWHGHSAEPSILSEIATHKESAREALRSKDSRSGKLSRNSQSDLGVDGSMFDSLISQTMSSSRKNARNAAPVDSMLSRSGFQNSVMGSRAVNVEELFDIQQQAEFFVSLGQHDQAIELLRQHIYGASSTSGLAYLDLLQLYHKFNRRQEYDQLRAEFNQSFNAHVPPFDQFGHQNRGIERYPTAISRITEGWNTPDISQILQDCIFRKPNIGDSETFDLEAYRELLLLFAIANEVHESDPVPLPSRESASILLRGKDGKELNVNPAPFASNRSPISGDTVNLTSKKFTDGVGSHNDLGSTHLSLPTPSPRLGLDVDLFELESVMAPLESLSDLEPLDFTLSDPTPLAATPVDVVEPPHAASVSAPVKLDMSKYFAEGADGLSLVENTVHPKPL